MNFPVLFVTYLVIAVCVIGIPIAFIVIGRQLAKTHKKVIGTAGVKRWLIEQFVINLLLGLPPHLILITGRLAELPSDSFSWRTLLTIASVWLLLSFLSLLTLVPLFSAIRLRLPDLGAEHNNNASYKFIKIYLGLLLVTLIAQILAQILIPFIIGLPIVLIEGFPIYNLFVGLARGNGDFVLLFAMFQTFTAFISRVWIEIIRYTHLTAHESPIPFTQAEKNIPSYAPLRGFLIIVIAIWFLPFAFATLDPSNGELQNWIKGVLGFRNLSPISIVASSGSIALLALAIIIAFRKPPYKAAYLLCLLFGLYALTGLYVFEIPLFLQALSFIALGLTAPIQIHFAINFPYQPNASLASYRGLIPTLYATTIGITPFGVILLLFPQLITSIEKFSPVGTMAVISLLLNLLSTLLLGWVFFVYIIVYNGIKLLKTISLPTTSSVSTKCSWLTQVSDDILQTSKSSAHHYNKIKQQLDLGIQGALLAGFAFILLIFVYFFQGYYILNFFYNWGGLALIIIPPTILVLYDRIKPQFRVLLISIVCILVFFAYFSSNIYSRSITNLNYIYDKDSIALIAIPPAVFAIFVFRAFHKGLWRFSTELSILILTSVTAVIVFPFLIEIAGDEVASFVGLVLFVLIGIMFEKSGLNNLFQRFIERIWRYLSGSNSSYQTINLELKNLKTIKTYRELDIPNSLAQIKIRGIGACWWLQPKPMQVNKEFSVREINHLPVTNDNCQCRPVFARYFGELNFNQFAMSEEMHQTLLNALKSDTLIWVDENEAIYWPQTFIEKIQSSFKKTTANQNAIMNLKLAQVVLVLPMGTPERIDGVYVMASDGEAVAFDQTLLAKLKEYISYLHPFVREQNALLAD